MGYTTEKRVRDVKRNHLLQFGSIGPQLSSVGRCTRNVKHPRYQRTITTNTNTQEEVIVNRRQRKYFENRCFGSYLQKGKPEAHWSVKVVLVNCGRNTIFPSEFNVTQKLDLRRTTMLTLTPRFIGMLKKRSGGDQPPP